MLGWSAPALPHLVGCRPNSKHSDDLCDLPVQFSDDEGGWIGSTSTLGALAAALVSHTFWHENQVMNHT